MMDRFDNFAFDKHPSPQHAFEAMKKARENLSESVKIRSVHTPDGTNKTLTVTKKKLPEQQSQPRFFQSSLNSTTGRKLIKDCTLIQSVKKLITEKLNDERYNTDRDVIELCEEIQPILANYDAAKQLTDTERADLFDKKKALKDICEFITENTPSDHSCP